MNKFDETHPSQQRTILFLILKCVGSGSVRDLFPCLGDDLREEVVLCLLLFSSRRTT